MPQRRASGISRRAVLSGIPAVLLGRALAVTPPPAAPAGFAFQPLCEPKAAGFAHIVLAAEGFRETERAAFLTIAERYAHAIRTQEPFAAFADRLLVNVAWQPSRDSGIPCVLEYDESTGRWIPQPTDRQSVFQSRLHRGRAVIEVGNYHAIRTLSSASPHPIDNLIVVVNDRSYGGGALAALDLPAAAFHAHKLNAPIAYAEALKRFTFGLTLATCDPKLGTRVLVHELGHSIANLGEEYFSPDVVFPARADHPALRKPNVSFLSDPRLVKWSGLVGTENVGVFEGAEGFGRGLFRPWDDGCVMRRPEHERFCPVCRQAITAELHTAIQRRTS